MTPAQQAAFVDDLCTLIAREVKDAIRANKIPAEWDGHELRALLAQKFEAATLRTLSRDGALRPRSPRRREFDRLVLWNNL